MFKTLMICLVASVAVAIKQETAHEEMPVLEVIAKEYLIDGASCDCVTQVSADDDLSSYPGVVVVVAEAPAEESL